MASRVLLVLALLAGWQSALLHPLQHADERGALIHLGGERDGGSELCDALGALTACAPESPFRFEPPTPRQDVALSWVTEWRLPQPPPFFAQGPPVRL
jgi:hypothetical protein